ncbi:DUF2339 domain-containing protein [Rufibacter quisquiliarum]|uniref:Putative membrane protein n=1 Tax=Rufibacter quisquiliarum TaxID=1549639 RepID=A0A839GLQ7_9BACT|nr:DUF2339 domain-containing protein [Rufibacter quisquiliarum]MBA9076515.1 putative membrane protein [Rufibacter quisquiliarum]
MEVFLLLVLVILVLWFGKSVSRHLLASRQEMQEVREELARLREQVNRSVVRPPVDAAAAAAQRDASAAVRAAPQEAPAPPKAPETAAPAPKFTPPPSILPPAAEKPGPAPTPIPAPPMAAFAPAAEEPAYTGPEPEKPFSFSQKIDWEKFIGENLINKLGIAILVLGIGFFVKYAIDQDWINEIGRVAIGLLAGGALVAVAHRLRQNYKAFSSVLIGGGMAVLYFTIAIAFHEYQIFSQTVAFILMTAITGFTIFLSMAYDRMELAVLALVGGFGSPFMVSTGEGNYVVLFVFILLLNAGILVLAYFKKWNLLNFIAYVFTIVLYGGWLFTRVVDTPNAPYLGALLFATLFYLVFFLITIIYNVKERQRFSGPEIMMLVSNTFLYYSAGLYVLHFVTGGRYQGLFTVALGAFNFVFAYALYRSQRVDRTLVYLLIGLVLTFLSLSAPIQLEGNYITLFWALEAVLLLWLSQKSGIQLMRYASVLVLALMLVSLCLDWMEYTVTRLPLPPALNKLFVTGVVAVASLAGTWWLLGRETPTPAQGRLLRTYRTIVGLLLVAFLYLVPLLELHHQLPLSPLSENTQTLWLGFYRYVFLLGLLLWSRRLRDPGYHNLLLGLSLLAAILYTLQLNPATVSLRNGYLFTQTETLGAYATHYLPLGALGAVLVLALVKVRRQYGWGGAWGKVSLWLISIMAVFLASTELEHTWLLVSRPSAEGQYDTLRHVHNIGFPILWGLCSFLLMMLGMSRKLKPLRIISLTLFFFTLLKLFLLDLRDMSEGGKIAAFICLGVLLLVISFMYQKLKNLILVDDSAPAENMTPLPDEK